MYVRRQVGALVIGLAGIASVQPSRLFAQGPVAVPIVGSPAAQSPATTPNRPPDVPGQPNPQAASPAPPAAATAPIATAPAVKTERKLDVSFANGTVAIDAQNVTIREILMEWQRRGGCQFINADKITGTPVSIQFPAGTPELEAIDSLLHGLGTATTGYGYIVAPAASPNVSPCGAVYIVASSRPTSSAGYVPTGSSPMAAPLMTPGFPDDEIPPVTPFPPAVPPAQPRPLVPGQNPNQPGQGQNPPAGGPGSNNTPAPHPQSPGFGPVAPTAPGATRIGAPPPTPAPNGPGRGGAE